MMLRSIRDNESDTEWINRKCLEYVYECTEMHFMGRSSKVEMDQIE